MNTQISTKNKPVNASDLVDDAMEVLYQKAVNLGGKYKETAIRKRAEMGKRGLNKLKELR